MNRFLILLTVCASACYSLLDRNIEKSTNSFKEAIRDILELHDEEKSTILTNGEWVDLGSWGAIVDLANSAYHISLVAIDAIHHDESPINELKTLNNGLLNLLPSLKQKNLSISETESTLAINFTHDELFENGTMEETPNSIQYLPIMGVLFNHNSHSKNVLAKLVQACQVYDAVKLVKNLVYALKIEKPEIRLSQEQIMKQMIRLNSRASEMKLASYALIIMHAECLALSQKPHLRDRDPKAISPALPHFTTALNLLQAKFRRSAENLLPKHIEL